MYCIEWNVLHSLTWDHCLREGPEMVSAVGETLSLSLCLSVSLYWQLTTGGGVRWHSLETLGDTGGHGGTGGHWSDQETSPPAY